MPVMSPALMAHAPEAGVPRADVQPMIGCQRAKALAALALCLFLIPALAWLTTVLLMSDVDAQWREVSASCSMPGSDCRPISSADRAAWCRSNAPLRATSAASAQAIRQACAAASEVTWVRSLATGGALLGALLVGCVYGARWFAGTDRRRMSLVFGPTLRLVLVLLALSTLTQAGLFGYGILVLELMALHGVHIGILMAGVVGTSVICFALLRAAAIALKDEPMAIPARRLEPSQHPRLFELIGSIAAKLGSIAPEHVVLGLDPVFFVSTASLRLIGDGDRVLRGHTLYLSLCLMRVFTVDELATVIGHELGHLRGGDLDFSERFAPTYARLRRTIDTLNRPAGLAAEIGRVPAIAALSLCESEFASAERTVGREREMLADKAGAEVVDARTLGCALIKSAVLADQWGSLTHSQLECIGRGQEVPRVAQAYALQCGAFIATLNWSTARTALEEAVQPHPVDTHPCLAKRLERFNLRMADYDPAELAVPARAASDLLDCADEFDRDLSAKRSEVLREARSTVSPD